MVVGLDLKKKNFHSISKLNFFDKKPTTILIKFFGLRGIAKKINAFNTRRYIVVAIVEIKTEDMGISKNKKI